MNRLHEPLHICLSAAHQLTFKDVFSCKMSCMRARAHLLKSLIDLALLEQLQDVGLLRLVVEVRGGDGRAGGGPHGLHDAGGDHRLLLLHRQAHLPLDDPLHVAKNRLLHAGGGTERDRLSRGLSGPLSPGRRAGKWSRSCRETKGDGGARLAQVNGFC